MAKRDVSAIVSGAGLVAGVWTDLVNAVRERGGTDEDIHRLSTPAGKATIAKMADLILGAGRKVFCITVNYDLTLAAMIKAGRYDWVDPEVKAENFPVRGEGQIEVAIELIHFNRYLESEEVISELDQMGLRPATLPELLAFGAKNPDMQREFSIVALGSVWRDRDGYRDVPYLWGGSLGRRLDLSGFESGWSSDCRFAAVRK